MSLRVALLAAVFILACGPEDKSGGPAGDGGGGGGGGDGSRARDGSGGTGTVQPGSPCEFISECAPGSTCYEGVCVGEGALRFSMSWITDTDIDLHVITPGGNEIYYDAPTQDGGTLDVDDCVEGLCAVQDGTHVENVVFMADAPRGSYQFWAHNYDAEVATSVTIDAFVDGVPMTFVETVPTGGAAEGVRHRVTY